MLSLSYTYLMDFQDRFTFRIMKKEDLNWFVNLRNLVRNSLHDTRFFTLDDATVWFKNLHFQEYYVVSYSNENGIQSPIGYVRNKLIDTMGVAEIGLDLHPNFQGKGLGFQVYVSFAKFQMKSSNVRIWILRVKDSNSRAISLYRKLGFTKAGVYNLNNEENEYLMVNCVENVATITSLL